MPPSKLQVFCFPHNIDGRRLAHGVMATGKDFLAHTEALDLDMAVSQPQDHMVAQGDLGGGRKFIRKLDARVVPLCAGLYFFAFLDRSSIGNARVLGLEKEIPFAGDEWNLVLTVFFITYIVFEM